MVGERADRHENVLAPFHPHLLLAIAIADPGIGFVAGLEPRRRGRILLPLDILAAFSALFTISRVDFLHKYVLVRIDTISRYEYNTMERVRK